MCDEPMPMHADGQDWLVSWHASDDVPDGRGHGAAGVCVSPDGLLVLISTDGQWWDLPAGRPEGDETDEETLRREMREEACVEVVTARLLGYARGECLQGHEAGLVLVRSFWRADVRVDPWEPAFEIPHRQLVPAQDVGGHLREPASANARILRRALVEAGLVEGDPQS